MVALNLDGKRAVVVGGGVVARRKVSGLLASGARVTVIAPELERGLSELVSTGQIEHVAREFAAGDLAGASVVISATGRVDVNAAVANEAASVGALVNVVDDPARGDFHVPALVRRGPVTLAVSTGGRSPALARRLRERLEAAIGPEYGALAELLGELRPAVLARGRDEAARRRAWEAVLDSEVLELLRRGEAQAAREKAEECISLELD